MDMVNASELRIGNLIEENGKIVSVDNIVGNMVNPYMYCDVEETTNIQNPLSLSEDLLIKSGFIMAIKPYLYFFGENLYQVVIMSSGKFIFRGLGASIVEITCFHHLQNLIYCVTGQELDTSKIVKI